MDKLNNMQVFCRIVELGSFAAVAREKNLSAMMISKYIAQLEASLGICLLNRTTRQVNPTEAGNSYYQRCKQLLEDLASIEQYATQLSQCVKGTLKIIAPIDFGGIHLIPAIEAYQKKFLDVNVLMTLDNGRMNLSDGSYDLAIRVTDKVEPGVIAKKLGTTELSTYASPSYIAKFGHTTDLEALAEHRCLHYTDTPHGDYWIFFVNGELVKIKPKWHFASNNGRALCQAAALGMGIVQAPDLSVTNYVKKGDLVEIFHDFRIPPIPIYVTYLQRRFFPAKLTTFVEFLIAYFDKVNFSSE